MCARKELNAGGLLPFLLALAGMLLSPLPAPSAVFDPAFRFKTLETGHFSIHYHQGIDPVAEKVAAIAEDVHDRLVPVLHWNPKQKTQLVLVDNSDFANGLATVLPYNAIYVFVTPPLPEMTIGDYEDWLELVILHEYVHILTMDPTRGVSSVMRALFGKTLPGFDPLSALLFLVTAPPNVFMPGWWHEGMATWAETEFTDRGRGRSSYFEMIYRMDVAEQQVPRIDEFNGDPPDWPGVSRRYIYGSLLEKQIERRHGAETLGRINFTQAGRFPYFINATPKRHTGKHYVEQYREMVKDLRDDQTRKLKTLKSQPLTTLRLLPVKGERLTNPRLSPGGRYLAVNRRDPHVHQELLILEAQTHEVIKKVRRLPSDHGVSWSPDGEKLYFTQSGLRRGFNLYQDIFRYDMKDDSVRRVTRGMRSKDIDLSPDGQRVAFVQVQTLTQSLALLTLDTKKVDHLFTGGEGQALSGPRWSADGKNIVFSLRDTEGNTSLELVETAGGKITTLLKSGANTITPTWSPDGRFVLFTSDGTGVYNLYALEIETGAIRQVTHVIGGAFQPDISPDSSRIVFSSYHARGFSLAQVPYEPSRWRASSSPAITPFWDNGTATEEKPEKSDPAGTTGSGKNYSAASTLAPGFWLPTMTFDQDGPVFGAFTAGADVLGYHAYVVNPGIGTGGELYGNAMYLYNRWYPSFFLRGYSLPSFYSDFLDGEDNYYEKRTALSAGVVIPLRFVESSYSFTAGYQYEYREHLTDIWERRVGDLEVFEGRRDNLFVGLEYGGALRYPHSISNEEGRKVSLLFRNYSEKLGSDLDQREYSAQWQEFIRLGHHHALQLTLKGATSEGDRIAQQAFQLGGPPVAVSEYPLRGFSQGFDTGRHLVTGSLEYRFPVLGIFRGWNTKPLFFEKMHLALFTDVGNIWGDGEDFSWEDFSVGIGAEVRMDMVLGYYITVTPALGIAHGVTDGGESQLYFTIYLGL